MQQQVASNTTATTVARPAKPTLFIKPAVWTKMLLYARLCNVEISGLGFIDVLPDNRGFLVSDIIVPQQKGSAGGTELDPEDLGKTISEWIMNGQEEKNEKMRFWWHFGFGFCLNV